MMIIQFNDFLMKSTDFLSQGGIAGRGQVRNEGEMRWVGRNGPKMVIADKGLLLNVGCANQGLILLAGGCRQKAVI
jgi:hypothetical protein